MERRVMSDVSFQYDSSYKSKIAIIGCGKASISCAIGLRYYFGSDYYDITIFDIPKYPNTEEDEISQMKYLTVKIVNGKSLGSDFTIQSLKTSFDAVFVGIGLSQMDDSLKNDLSPLTFSDLGFANVDQKTLNSPENPWLFVGGDLIGHGSTDEADSDGIKASLQINRYIQSSRDISPIIDLDVTRILIPPVSPGIIISSITAGHLIVPASVNMIQRAHNAHRKGCVCFKCRNDDKGGVIDSVITKKTELEKIDQHRMTRQKYYSQPARNPQEKNKKKKNPHVYQVARGKNSRR